MRRSFRSLVTAMVAAVGIPVVVFGLTNGAAHAQIDPTTPPPPLVCNRTIDIGDRIANEGTATTSTVIALTPFTFTVSSRGCNRAGTVSYRTEHGTTNSYDYVSTSGTLTFAEGDGSNKNITVLVRKDGSPGNNESFRVRLYAPSANVVVDDGSGLGVILNDDTVCQAPPDLPPGTDYHCSE